MSDKRRPVRDAAEQWDAFAEELRPLATEAYRMGEYQAYAALRDTCDAAKRVAARIRGPIPIASCPPSGGDDV